MIDILKNDQQRFKSPSNFSFYSSLKPIYVDSFPWTFILSE